MKLPEIRLSYSNPVKKSERQKITTSADACIILRTLFNTAELELREQLIVLYLNHAAEVIGYTKHSVGGITGTVLDVRLILAGALKSLSTGIIISHNHPSGTLKPSQSDISITTQLKLAAKSLDIQLTDHIIITKEGHYSFSDEGLNGISSSYKTGHYSPVNIIHEPENDTLELLTLELQLESLSFKQTAK